MIKSNFNLLKEEEVTITLIANIGIKIISIVHIIYI